MSTLASVFISHSAKDTEGRTYLEAIKAAFKDRFGIWVDETRLKGSDNWSVVIANEMAECHAAVALFSTEALRSEYFKFEISNLFARWMREDRDANRPAAERFRFCPVVVPPLTVDAVKAAPFVSATYLGIGNWIVPSSPADAVNKLDLAFDQLTGWPSPLQALEAKARRILSDVRERAIYLDAARYAGFTDADFAGSNDPAASLARLYMRCPIDRLCASLRRIQPVLDDVMKLFDLLAPSWVSFEAGRRFESYLCTGTSVPQARVAIITGQYAQFTPLMYLLRARGDVQIGNHVLQVPEPREGGMSEASLLHGVENELTSFFREHYGSAKDGTLLKELGQLHVAFDQQDRPKFEPLLRKFVQRFVFGARVVIVAVPVGPADFDLMEKVSSQPWLQQVTFVALRDSTHPEPRDTTHVITPEVARDYEDLAYLAFSGFTDP